MKIELPDPVPTLIENVTGELSVNIGKTLSDIWFLVFGELSHFADKRHAKFDCNLSIYKQELSDSTAKIPKDKRIEPSLQITAQALENSKYCIEEKELRQMFVALISHSMNSDFTSETHPSFAEIIKQMSVLDAKIIQLFKKDGKPIVGLPICQYQLNLFDSLSHVPIPDHIFLELPDIDFRLCSKSISSLSRLGIISISYEKKLDTPNLYNKFSQHPVYKYIEKQVPFQVMIKEGVVSLTPLGHSFVAVCLPD